MNLLSKKSITKRNQEVLAYIDNCIKRKQPDRVRVVIFGQGRTGSTLLESLLCSTGHFYQNGELLSTDQGEIIYPVQYIKGLSKRKSDGHFIFHVKIYHLTRDRKRPVDPASFLKSLYYDGFKIIYLKRLNIIKHSLSGLVAEHRGCYHKFDNGKENLRLFLDCDGFVKKVNERVLFSKEEELVLSGIRYHEVVYEDDLENDAAHQRAVDHTLDFLSLERKKVSTKHIKVNTTSIEKLIVNYNEFVDCMKKNGWEDFLD